MNLLSTSPTISFYTSQFTHYTTCAVHHMNINKSVSYSYLLTFQPWKVVQMENNTNTARVNILANIDPTGMEGISKFSKRLGNIYIYKEFWLKYLPPKSPRSFLFAWEMFNVYSPDCIFREWNRLGARKFLQVLNWGVIDKLEWVGMLRKTVNQAKNLFREDGTKRNN